MRFPQLIHYRPAVPPSNQPPTFPAPNRLSPLQTLLSLSPLLTLLVVARPFVVEWPIAIAVPDRFLVSAARWRAQPSLSLAPHGKSQCSNYLLHGTPPPHGPSSVRTAGLECSPVNRWRKRPSAGYKARRPPKGRRACGHKAS